MNFIKKLFGKKNKNNTVDTSNLTPCPNMEKKLGGHDLDDKAEVESSDPIVKIPAEPNKVETAAKKKPGRPKGSTKKTPSKSTPSKKVAPKKKD